MEVVDVVHVQTPVTDVRRHDVIAGQRRRLRVPEDALTTVILVANIHWKQSNNEYTVYTTTSSEH